MTKKQHIINLLHSGDRDNIRLALTLAQSQGINLSDWWESVAEIWKLCQKTDFTRLPTREQMLDEVMAFTIADWRNKQLRRLPHAMPIMLSLRMLNLWENRALNWLKTIAVLEQLPNLNNVKYLSDIYVKWQERHQQDTFIANYHKKSILSPTQQKMLLHSVFSTFPNIKKLALTTSWDLPNTPIEIPASFYDLSFFYWGKNTHSIEWISNLYTLTTLTIGGAVSLIPESFAKLTKLRQLIIHHNKLLRLPDGIGNCTELQELDISFNFILNLPDSISNLQKLKILKLHSNPLDWKATIPIIAQLPALEKITVSLPNIAPDLLNLLKKHTQANVMVMS